MVLISHVLEAFELHRSVTLWDVPQSEDHLMFSHAEADVLDLDEQTVGVTSCIMSRVHDVTVSIYC